MRSQSSVAVVLAVSALTACGTSRNIEGVASGASVCTICHGGQDNETGAPPLDTRGNSASAAVGAHTAHLDAGVACRSCHLPVDPNEIRFPGHQNGVVDVIFGGDALDPGSVATPAYDRATHSCSSVYCHAPSTAPGGALPDPQWTGSIASAGCGACHAGPSTIHGGGIAQTACTACHPTSVDAAGGVRAPPGGTHADGTVQHFQHDPGWATTNANGVTPHGLAATYQDKAGWPTGFDGCRTCHGSNLDNPIASSVPSCDSCHTGGTAAWRTTCTFCHGDATRAPAGSQLADAAPPRDVLGGTASQRVGAHQVHLLGDPGNTPVVSDGVACDDCHGGTTRTLPTSFEPHANGTTEVTLKQPGQNVAIGTYDPASGTCAGTYCHGKLPRNAKATLTVASWTATTGWSACTACHYGNGITPATDTYTREHRTHDCSQCHGTSTTRSCQACHAGFSRNPLSVNTATHVDGVVEINSSVTISGHTFSISWNPTGGSGFGSCTTDCHSTHGVGTTQSW